MFQGQQYNEWDLLQKIAEGDQGAFDQVYHAFSPALFNAIMVYVKNVHLADEILQIVFIKFWEKREGLGNVRSLEDFLFIMARNTVLNHWKNAVLEHKVLVTLWDHSSHMENDTANGLQEKEYRRVFQDALSQLPTQQYRVYLLATEEELSYEEIAVELQLSRFTVKKHLELARRFIRSYVNQYFHTYVVIALILSHSVFRGPVKKRCRVIRPFSCVSCLYDKERLLHGPGTLYLSLTAV